MMALRISVTLLGNKIRPVIGRFYKNTKIQTCAKVQFISYYDFSDIFRLGILKLDNPKYNQLNFETRMIFYDPFQVISVSNRDRKTEKIYMKINFPTLLDTNIRQGKN